MARQSKPHVHRGHWRTRIDGQEHQLGPAGTEAQKRAAFAAFYKLMHSRLKERAADDQPDTVAGAVAAWLEINRAEAYARWLREFVNHCGAVALADVGHDLLWRFAGHLADVRYSRFGRIVNAETGERVQLPPRPLSERTRAHYVKTARAVLAWAAKRGWCALPDLPQLERAADEARDVAPARLWSTLDALPERAGRILRFIGATGCRPSEACGLKWEHVRADLGVCVLPHHKTARRTGEPRVIDLNPEARAALNGLTPGDGYVFTSRLGTPYTSAGLRAILWRHGGFTPYQLRHSFAQAAIDQGEPAEVVTALLGHKTSRMVWNYARIRDERRHAAALRLRLRPVATAG